MRSTTTDRSHPTKFRKPDEVWKERKEQEEGEPQVPPQTTPQPPPKGDISKAQVVQEQNVLSARLEDLAVLAQEAPSYKKKKEEEEEGNNKRRTMSRKISGCSRR